MRDKQRVMSVEGCNESTPIVNGEEEEEEDDEEEAQRNFRTASFNLGSSFEVINSRHRGSSASYSSGSDLCSSSNTISPPSALKGSLLRKAKRTVKRKRNVSFAGSSPATTTQLDLREAGYVVKPTIKISEAAQGQSTSGTTTLLNGGKGEDVYVLYEEEEEAEKGAEPKQGSTDSLNPVTLRTTPGRSMSPSIANTSVYSIVSTGGGVIDGRFSFSAGTPGDGFVAVEAPTGSYGPASISVDLQVCKRTVLKPYLWVLKVIGWRKLIDDGARNVRFPRCVSAVNFIHPALIFAMLVLALVSQILTCFYRDQPVFFEPITNHPLIGETNTLNVTCQENLVTKLLFPDALLLATYLIGLYIFRYGEPEHLAAVMETVFLSANAQHVKSRKRRLIFILRTLLVLAGAWLFYDIIVNIGRGFTLRVFFDTPPIGFLPGLQIRYLFIVTTLLGFFFFDMVYISVIITYASQSELIQFYIMSIIDRVNTKAYSLEDAMKDIHRTYDYLRVMNGKLATLTTLCLLIFLEAMLSSMTSVLHIGNDVRKNTLALRLSVAVGISGVVLWAVLVGVPVAQAARLTAKCRKLRRLGLQIRSRPFIYSDTPQLDLDSFLQYTNSTRYTAKLASVPIYPSFIFGGLFLIAIVGSFVIFSYPTFQFAPWF